MEGDIESMDLVSGKGSYWTNQQNVDICVDQLGSVGCKVVDFMYVDCMYEHCGY